MSLMVITNQKPIIDRKVIKRREFKQITKESLNIQEKTAREKEMNKEKLQKHPEKNQ